MRKLYMDKLGDEALPSFGDLLQPSILYPRLLALNVRNFCEACEKSPSEDSWDDEPSALSIALQNSLNRNNEP